MELDKILLRRRQDDDDPTNAGVQRTALFGVQFSSSSSPRREVAYILTTLNQERKMGYAITWAEV